MLVGHTKFAPDWCFGLLKQKFRKTKVGCLSDIAKVVDESATVNSAELVGKEDGTVLIKQYDWAEFFKPVFKATAFKGIKKLHHLVFSKDTPGCAIVREYPDSTIKKLTLLSSDCEDWSPVPSDLPPELLPPGLSQERKEYLYSKIREFCPPDCKDIVCPDPHVAKPSSPLPHMSTPPTSPEPITPETTPLTSPEFIPPRTKRRCNRGRQQ